MRYFGDATHDTERSTMPKITIHVTDTVNDALIGEAGKRLLGRAAFVRMILADVAAGRYQPTYGTTEQTREKEEE